MTCICFICQGPTEWNTVGRIQGQADFPFSAEGRAKMVWLTVPQSFSKPRIFISNLARSQETARLLGFADFTVDARLAEQNWGHWEGFRGTRSATATAKMHSRAGLALDFHPPGGEAIREIIARVRAFLVDIAKEKQDTLAVTHHGVIRTAYALATDWGMESEFPEDLDFSAALILALDAKGAPRIEGLNVSLPERN